MHARLFCLVGFAGTRALVSPAYADDLTVSGNAFSALDGSLLHHGGEASGVFTVSDGNLTVRGRLRVRWDGTIARLHRVKEQTA